MSITTVKARIAGSTTIDDGGEPAVHDLTDFHVTFAKATDDALPADVIADTLIWTNPFSFPVQVISGRYAPTSGDIVANNTNNATLQIKTDDGAPGGAAPAVALSYATNVSNGGVLQNDSKAFPFWVAAASMVPPGGGVWFAAAKTGTGVVVRAGLVSLRLRKL
jgi:hypothetical protein